LFLLKNPNPLKNFYEFKKFFNKWINRNLGYNFFVGTIPESIGKLPNLKYL